MWSKLEKIFPYLVFAGIIFSLFCFITSMENRNTFFDYEKTYITPTHIILIPIAYFLYGFMFKNMFINLFKTLKIIFFLAVTGVLFYVSYETRTPYKFAISVPVIYCIYGAISINNFFVNTRKIIIQSILLSAISYFATRVCIFGLESTIEYIVYFVKRLVDGLIYCILVIVGIVIFIKWMSSIDWEGFRKETEILAREEAERKEQAKHDSELNNLNHDIDDLKHERKKTYRDITHRELSSSELKRKWENYDEITKNIDELEDKKNQWK